MIHLQFIFNWMHPKLRRWSLNFRKEKTPIAPIIINGEPSESVDCFKFLGMIISSDLGSENNIDAVVKKLNKRCTTCANYRSSGWGWRFLLNSSVLSLCWWEYSCIVNMCVVRRHQLIRVVKTTFKIVNSVLTPLTAVYNDKSKKEPAILSQTKLTPLIICSNYCRRANVLEASVRKQIALEIVFTAMP